MALNAIKPAVSAARCRDRHQFFIQVGIGPEEHGRHGGPHNGDHKTFTSQATPTSSSSTAWRRRVLLKYVTGKNCGEAKFPLLVQCVMFTSIDERAMLWLGAEDASDFERTRCLNSPIQLLDFIRVTKIKHPRGGGSSLRVERVADEGDAREPEPQYIRQPKPQFPAPSREEALLEKSVELAREWPRPRSTGCRGIPPDPAPAPAVPQQTTATYAQTHGRVPAHELVSGRDRRAISEAQAYSRSQGLKVTFTSEDVKGDGDFVLHPGRESSDGGALLSTAAWLIEHVDELDTATAEDLLDVARFSDKSHRTLRLVDRTRYRHRSGSFVDRLQSRARREKVTRQKKSWVTGGFRAASGK